MVTSVRRPKLVRRVDVSITCYGSITAPLPTPEAASSVVESQSSWEIWQRWKGFFTLRALQ